MDVNTEVIRQLTMKYRDDEAALEMLESALTSFEEYHAAIYKMEIKMKIYGSSAQSTIQELDRSRSSFHNALLSYVRILNRMAESEGLPPFYDGVVSEERPYRREVADAVLKYVEKTIAERA